MDLVNRVARELSLSQEQAEGSVGAVLWLAQTRLDQQPLQRLADCIPGFSDLVGKSPRFDPVRRTWYGWLNQLVGGAGGIRILFQPLAKLGLPHSVAASTIAIVVQYVGEHGGPEVEDSLRRVLS